MGIPKSSFNVPRRTNLINAAGQITDAWDWFFRSLEKMVYPLGQEQTFTLANDQSTAADIDGMVFNKIGVSVAFVEYLIQRVTTGTGATELVEAGLFIVSYNPTSEDWNLNVVSENNPDDAGVVFSINSSGQVRYTSTDVTGDNSLSRIVWRSRTLGAKAQSYSSIGSRQ